MVNTRISAAIAASLACMATACSGTSDDKMRLIDTYASTIVVRESMTDSAAIATKTDSILNANGYTEESFREALRTVGNNPSAMKEMYDSVGKRLEVLRKK